ncbi:patatin-like phospholipase family protein [Roseateles koreensis]|uniref:Patatin-like phospholipase family protein n=1 Tax=Roseateles koreensis TaxID=2987526 RepID=A0ABT5KW85_9BURK|nr:patatin-like phospholipase family protein [Roseateles koreensis]MDC8786081.1 patatin-like phospholipase family protein [Roseateles koreensis]
MTDTADATSRRACPYRRAVITLLLVSLQMSAAAAQPAAEGAAAVSPVDVSTPPRPKICLVLSGGGARGAAHTGVLRVLEELRVPIDCIAGTSMGALVGGAYATGMSVAEMDAINAGITVEKLFKEEPPRQELNMRRKTDSFVNYIGPEVGAGAGASNLGKGLATGVQLETVLRQLSKVQGYRQFDALPIPFRAVATDLVTGKAVVFKEGEMANVMRASMSVPGAVAPAEIRGMMLVDGMLTSNLPVDAARAMGADIVIAVNVGTPLLKREALNSIVGVAGQMLSILTEQNVQASIASLKPSDILISPDLGDFSTADFDQLAKISPLGEAAARAVADRLAKLSLPAAEYAALRQQQQAPLADDARPVDAIRFTPMKRVNPEAALEVMTTHTKQPIDQAALDADMRRLYGTGDFEHVGYRIDDTPEQRTLTVDAEEKSWGPDYLRFGLAIDTDFSSGNGTSLLATYRRTWLNALGAEWRTDLRLGEASSLSSEFYQPFDTQGDWFVSPNVQIERHTLPVFTRETRLAVVKQESARLGVDIGRYFNQYGEFRLGVQTGWMERMLDTGPDQARPSPAKIRLGSVGARVLMDRLDSAQFPRSGWYLKTWAYASRPELGADQRYTKWELQVSGVASLGDSTLNVLLESGGKLGSADLPSHDLFQWGGFLQQSGYATGQLLGQRLDFGRVMYYSRVAKGGLLAGKFAGISLELGRMRGPFMPDVSDGWRKSAAAFVGMDTPVGPVYFGYGRASDGPGSFYLTLGPAY